MNQTKWRVDRATVAAISARAGGGLDESIKRLGHDGVAEVRWTVFW
jgi:hypothetical protein